MSLNFTDRPSPNFGERPTATIDMIVLHYTGMKTGKEALDRLCDKEAGVSAHYLVETDGEIFRLVDEEKRAHHAGVSHWAGQNNVNDTSIGIEIVNPGHFWGYEAFPEKQIEAVIALVGDIVERHDISPKRVIGHSDVAPTRKEDPGELFPWKLLAEKGLAISPFDGEVADHEPLPDYETCLTMLGDIGYLVDGVNHAAPLAAFQRRFCPQSLGQGLDPYTRAALKVVHQAHTE